MNMLKAVFCMEHACDVNAFIYRLRRLHFFRKWISEQWYGKEGLKSVFSILTFAGDILWLFIRQLLYVGFMIYFPAWLVSGNVQGYFLHIFFVFTFMGAFINGGVLDPEKKKYYAVNLMGADPRKYALFSFALSMTELFTGALPAYLLFGQMAGLTWQICLLFPAAAVLEKVCGTAAAVKGYEKTGKIFQSDHVWCFMLLLLFCAGAAYLPCAAGLCLPWQVQAGAGAAAAVLSPVSVRYLLRTKVYKKLYKQRMTFEHAVFNAKETSAGIQKQAYEKHLEEGSAFSDKKGYEYFNDIFVQRHKKILTRSAKRVACMAGIFLTVLFSVCLFFEKAREITNEMLLNFLPYTVFIMYLLNRGESIAKAMFFNCDHSMLTYRFYRQPDAVLHLFKVRMKTLIRINLLPGSVIAAGLTLLLFISGGSPEKINYILIPSSVLAMSVFFSVHHLVLYYLLQPYNVQLETKSHGYSIATFLTYIFCYLFIRLQMSTLVFAVLLLLFCAGYIFTALKLVYRKAPETFRLK